MLSMFRAEALHVSARTYFGPSFSKFAKTVQKYLFLVNGTINLILPGIYSVHMQPWTNIL